MLQGNFFFLKKKNQNQGNRDTHTLKIRYVRMLPAAFFVLSPKYVYPTNVLEIYILDKTSFGSLCFFFRILFLWFLQRLTRRSAGIRDRGGRERKSLLGPKKETASILHIY